MGARTEKAVNDMKQTIFYFSPHQDDELTNLGAAICADLEQGREVFCVLCTDGGASGARKLLANGAACAWHEGQHGFALSREAFSAARDREFTASCLALGVAPDHIVIPAFRAPDGSGDRAAARRIMLEATAACPAEQTVIKTLLPVDWRRQNPDHTAIALVAKALLAEGRFADVRFYLEMILLPAPENMTLREIAPSPQARERLMRAADEYARWEPESGRYAVGVHSVYDEFEAYRQKPRSWLVEESTR